MRVLLIEDNPGDARLIQESLRETAQSPADDLRECVVAGTLGDGLERLRASNFDVILVDLELPDCQGLETFKRVQEGAPDLPTVVLSGLDDEATAVQAVRAGAQDYLVKGHVDGRLLERSLRYAIARRRAEAEHARRLQEEAARSRAEEELRRAKEAEQELRERLEREVRSVQRLTGRGGTTATARAYGVGPLRTASPDAFADALAEYGQILDLALEQRVYRVEHGLSPRLRALAERLGFYGVGPRDVVDVHTGALKGKLTGVLPARGQAYIEEARVLVLELMGHLVSYYRRQRGHASPE